MVKNPPASAGDVGSIPGSNKITWRRKWQRTPVFLPGKFYGQRSLVGCSPCGLKESDTTEQLHWFTGGRTDVSKERLSFFTGVKL